MITLNLTAETEEEKLIKTYLEENASEILADKINNGVEVEKDGKTLINKKTLSGFMKYASGEAKKQAAKGASSACVRSDVVFGWAIHYFEEESIEGTLYNEDGTEYKPAPKVIPEPITPPVVKEVKPPEPRNEQQSMLDMFDFDVPEREEKPEEEEEETIEEVIETPKEEKKSPLAGIYEEYLRCCDDYGEEVAVMMRIGDFYEIYGDMAKKISAKAELTLVSRDFGLTERVPMIGIPFHKLEFYLEKFREICGVAIIEKGKEPILMSKNTPPPPPRVEKIGNLSINTTTGEVIDKTETKVDKTDPIAILKSIFGDELEINL
ncbi:MAG: hypothetical protein J6Q67_03700 [Clostridia bacterium]|nr:hypothetical protein [Clostridia bacterium]